MFPEFDTPIETYQPDIDSGVLEAAVLAKTENRLFSEAVDNLDAVWMNQYISTANVYGIERFERVLGIVADPSTQDIEFRRARILNRYTMTPPYTLPFLKSKLDEILGEGKWSMTMDYQQRVLTVASVASTSAWAHEIAVTITKLKPANLVFIAKPLLADAVVLTEQIVHRARINNYRLGVSWFLGRDPFATYFDPEVIKTPGVHSIQAELLRELAQDVIPKISSVMVNDAYEIFEFELKTADNNVCTIEYTIPAAAKLGSITKLALMNGAKEMTSCVVYVDNTYDALISHKIIVKEGTS